MLIKIILFCAAIYLSDRLCLWLERKGWLYYRNKKASGGVMGSALLELHSLLQPGIRNVVEIKKNNVKIRQSEADDYLKNNN